MIYGEPVYWRETHRQPRFMMFDGRLVVVLLVCVMHIRPWTIALALSTIAILWFFDRKGVSADSILRFLRARLVGSRRTARGFAAERSAVDFGHETEADVQNYRNRIQAETLRHEALARKKAKGTAADRRQTSAG